jgi:hypothetical protein
MIQIEQHGAEISSEVGAVSGVIAKYGLDAEARTSLVGYALRVQKIRESISTKQRSVF